MALHEVTHVFTESYEHPPRFWEHFAWLLREMEAAGIYTSVDFSRYPADYCGLYLNHNPIYDPLTIDIRKIPVSEWWDELDGSLD